MIIIFAISVLHLVFGILHLSFYVQPILSINFAAMIIIGTILQSILLHYFSVPSILQQEVTDHDLRSQRASFDPDSRCQRNIV